MTCVEIKKQNTTIFELVILTSKYIYIYIYLYKYITGMYVNNIQQNLQKEYILIHRQLYISIELSVSYNNFNL